MADSKFTDKYLKALKPADKRYSDFSKGEDGFGVIVEPSGTMTFVTRYRNPLGKLVMIRLGHYGKTKLKDARSSHQDNRKLIGKGIDPKEARELAAAEERAELKRRQAELAAEQDADTISGLSARFIDKWAKKHHATAWREDKRMLDKDVIPAWGNRKVKDITRRDVKALMENIEARGAPVSANRTYGTIKQLFDYALDADIIDTTPCVRIKRQKEQPRTRVLTESEIKTFWEKLDSIKAHKSIKAALRFLLVTGQRRGEIAGAAWSEFDDDWWTIPETRTKNRSAHRVPLTKTAQSLLAELKELAGESEWVMPSPVKKTVPLTPRSLSRAISNDRDKFDLPAFSPHDLRRTAITMMRSNPRIRADIPRVVNHTPQDVTSRNYDLYAYDTEKQKALKWWDSRLQAILKGKTDNVVAIA